ncbi:MAG: hypothetical protein N2490_06515 [Ignavibacteria bacterium]|nr:hypothetical protein [Ignavibacteria bacterium]
MKYFNFFITFILSLCLIACKSETVTSPTPNVESESSTIKVGCELEKICTHAASLLIMVYRNQTLPSPQCPIVTWNSSAKKIIVDYGSTPCICSFDSTRKSGKYEINYYTNVAPDSIAGKITYSNFQIFRSNNPSDSLFMQISGSDDIGGVKLDSLNYRVIISMNNNFNRNNNTNGNAVITLNANVSIGSVGNILDDVFSILGNGALTNSGVTYTYNIYDNNKPLVMYSTCKYPVSGLVRLTSNNIEVINDFYPHNGACDPIVSILKNNVSVIVDLSSKF